MTTEIRITPTDVRLLAPCPFCRARQGDHCRRWRGGARKQNHMERVELARKLVER